MELFLIPGFVLLLLGGEASVRGSVALARRLGVSPFIVGLTIVGFGTSLPEMFFSVDAVLSGRPGLAVGNVIGSNIANLLLILGAASLLAPIAVNPSTVRLDTVAMALATLVFTGFGVTGGFTVSLGILLLVFLTFYIGFTIWYGEKSDRPVRLPHEETVDRDRNSSRIISIVTIIAFGLCAVAVGAELLVLGATELALGLGVPDEVIGLTVIAIGTSLPELATATVAAYRGQSEICVGNVLGSNIFNLFGITGVASLLTPTLEFSDRIINFDLLVLLAATTILVFFFITGRRIFRLPGFVFLCMYCAYVFAQYTDVAGAVY